MYLQNVRPVNLLPAPALEIAQTFPTVGAKAGVMFAIWRKKMGAAIIANKNAVHCSQRLVSERK